MIYICLGVGLLFSIITRFLQVRHFKDMIKLMFQGKSSDAGVSSFRALSIALSGRVGTGNIAGTATAIGFGGPGAVFWMWAIAFIGASTAFIESTLAQIYKEKHEGQYRGGKGLQGTGKGASILMKNRRKPVFYFVILNSIVKKIHCIFLSRQLNFY